MATLALVAALALVSQEAVPREETGPVVILAQDIEIEMGDGIALVRIETRLRNPSARTAEGRMVMALPEGAMPCELTLHRHISSSERHAKSVPRVDAARTYEEVVSQASRFSGPTLADAKTQRRPGPPADMIRDAMATEVERQRTDETVTDEPVQKRDPALLEYRGENTFSLRCFPVPARDTQRVTLTFIAPLQREGGRTYFTLPMNGSGLRRDPACKPSVRLRVRASEQASGLEAGRLRLTGRSEPGAAVLEASTTLSHDRLELSYAGVGGTVENDVTDWSQIQPVRPGKHFPWERAVLSWKAALALRQGADEALIAPRMALATPGYSLIVVEPWTAREARRR